jgi:hypothetical protein
MRHACNSASARRHPDFALDGIGAGSRSGCEWPGMQRTRAARLDHASQTLSKGYRRLWLAVAGDCRDAGPTVAIGYADGVHRSRANRGEVLVATGGRRDRHGEHGRGHRRRQRRAGRAGPAIRSPSSRARPDGVITAEGCGQSGTSPGWRRGSGHDRQRYQQPARARSRLVRIPARALRWWLLEANAAEYRASEPGPANKLSRAEGQRSRRAP